MAHHAHHLRQRDAKQDVETVISYEYVTMSKTFSGPAVYSTQTVNSDALASTRSSDAATATSTADDDGDETSVPATSQAARTTSDADPTTSASRTSTLVTSSVATSAAAASSLTSLSSSASSSYASSSSATATQAAAAGASSSAAVTEKSASSGALSGGAKAGLAIGIILAIGLVFGIAFLVYRRKKQQQNYSGQVDNEKHRLGSGGFMAAPVAAAETSPTTRTLSTAPRLSLRPVTEFLPNLTGNRKSAGNPLEAAGAAPRGYQAPTPQPTVSPWERRGAQNNANDPANPFGNHAELSEPVTNEKMAVAAAPASATSGRALTPPLVSSSPDEVQRDADVPKPLSIKSNHSDASFTTATSEPKVGTAITATSPAAAAAAAAAVAAAGVSGSAAASKPALPPSDAVYRVQMDFTPNMEDELTLKAGEVVRLLHEYDDGWALCIRMDRSQQGVVPRTCLSKNPVQPVQPRPANSPQPQGRPRGASQTQQSRSSMRSGPQSPGYHSAGRPQSPAGGRNSPGPQSPASGRGSPGLHGRLGQPMSPGRVQLGGFPTPPMSPAGRTHGGFPTPPRSPAKPAFRPGPPGGRIRSQSNAGLHGAPLRISAGTRSSQGTSESRRRSKSVGNMHEPFVPSLMSPMPNTPPSRIPVRKPVAGQSP